MNSLGTNAPKLFQAHNPPRLRTTGPACGHHFQMVLPTCTIWRTSVELGPVCSQLGMVQDRHDDLWHYVWKLCVNVCGVSWDHWRTDGQNYSHHKSLRLILSLRLNPIYFRMSIEWTSSTNQSIRLNPLVNHPIYTIESDWPIYFRMLLLCGLYTVFYVFARLLCYRELRSALHFMFIRSTHNFLIRILPTTLLL